MSGPLTRVACIRCAATRDVKPTAKGVARTPAGWRRHGEGQYCGTCWGKAFLMRAVTLPVASPLDCGWDELYARLRVAWQQATAASNWMMTELYARDVRRNGEEKMPPMAPVYLYPEVRERFPELPAVTVTALERACQKRYRAVRYKVLWTCGAALPNYRYPVPLPVPAQAWDLKVDEGVAVVSLRLGEGRVRLRLKGGAQFRRQVAMAAGMAAGQAVAGEAMLRQEGSSLLVTMAAWLPRAQAGEGRGRRGVLEVATRKESLLTASSAAGDVLWTYNADHLRRWQAEYSRRLQRWAEDHKYEQRPSPNFADRRSAAVRKHRHRMESACHEIAAQLVGYASRRRFAGLKYDDSERGFCEQFPWWRLRAMIAEKLDAAGIEFEMAGNEKEAGGQQE